MCLCFNVCLLLFMSNEAETVTFLYPQLSFSPQVHGLQGEHSRCPVSTRPFLIIPIHHLHHFLCRYMSAGRALTLLMPSEYKAMVSQLEEAKVGRLRGMECVLCVSFASNDEETNGGYGETA